MIYIRVSCSTTIEIRETDLEEAGLTLDDLYGFPANLLDENDVEYEIGDTEWETQGSNEAVYQWPKVVPDKAPRPCCNAAEGTHSAGCRWASAGPDEEE